MAAAVAEGLLAAPVGDADPDEDQGDRCGDGDHAGADAGQDRGGGTGFGLGRDLLDRTEVIGGVVLGGLAERPTDEKAADVSATPVLPSTV